VSGVSHCCQHPFKVPSLAHLERLPSTLSVSGKSKPSLSAPQHTILPVANLEHAHRSVVLGYVADLSAVHQYRSIPSQNFPSSQTCFVLPITSPRTFVQSILASNSSFTNPQITTLSPLTRYNPCGCSADGSSSSWGRIMRSTVSLSTRLVTWSQETRVPVRVRPSTVMMRTFSVGGSACCREGCKPGRWLLGGRGGAYWRGRRLGT